MRWRVRRGRAGTMPAMDRAALARMIDHTLLAPEATPGQVAMLCGEATELGVAAVCVSPNRLPAPGGALPRRIGVATVVGFPSGAHRPAVKAAEAAQAVADGATEVDMVIDLGPGHRPGCGAAWRPTSPPCAPRCPRPLNLKVIIESALLGRRRAHRGGLPGRRGGRAPTT